MWHYRAVSWSAENTQKLYFDGELVALAEGKAPQYPDRMVLFLTGQADMDLDELTIVSRRLSQSEIEASYASGLHAQQQLISPSPAIQVEVGEPIEAVGQQAQGGNKKDVLSRRAGSHRQHPGKHLCSFIASRYQRAAVRVAGRR